ncbi:hypothetical protein SO694_0018507 [Aureococcus anophagefferens]|uniref:Uncharacterized protein n=1 Tax=Aureococcus anophagefferens TaxID=44056 RepID=A0ABR1FG72_AURAN
MGILPSATDSKMLFDMPGVYQCLRAACGAPRARTSDRSFRARAPDRNRAELVVGRLFQSTAWSEHDERRRVADFEALDHDLRAPPSGSPSGAAAQTTADDERDARASRGDARAPGGLGLGASEPAPVPAPAPRPPARPRQGAAEARTRT